MASNHPLKLRNERKTKDLDHNRNVDAFFYYNFCDDVLNGDRDNDDDLAMLSL